MNLTRTARLALFVAMTLIVALVAAARFHVIDGHQLAAAVGMVSVGFFVAGGSFYENDNLFKGLMAIGVADTNGLLQGNVQTKESVFTENGAAGVYTGTIPIPAKATILDIIVSGVSLWTAGTSATMNVGDANSATGYYSGIDLKATDLLAGEQISLALAGGKAGAYIANSQANKRYSAAARVITGVVTTVGTAASTGETRMTVIFSLPNPTLDSLAATKV